MPGGGSVCEYDESERDEDYRNQTRSMHGVIVSRSVDRSAPKRDLRPIVSSLAAGLWMRFLLTLRLQEDSHVPEWQYARRSGIATRGKHHCRFRQRRNAASSGVQPPRDPNGGASSVRDSDVTAGQAGAAGHARDHETERERCNHNSVRDHDPSIDHGV
jgi:hypothetical protein